MTEQKSFVRRINEEPWEDTHRLVYADWLDERGDPKRAEFIREMVANPEVQWFTPIQGMRKFLEAGDELGIPERSVLGTFQVYQNFQYAVNDYGYIWSRGVVSGIRMRCEDFMHWVRRLFLRHPLEFVTLVDLSPFQRSEQPNTWSWFARKSFPDGIRNGYGNLSTIPGVFRDHLRAYRPSKRVISPKAREFRYSYTTAEAAQTDLATAIVRYGRWQAGLPKLPELEKAT